MSKEKYVSPRGLSSQMIIGSVVLTLGVLLLLDQFDILNIGNIFQFVPLLFIALGVWQLVSNGFRHWVGPSIMIGLMTLLQLSILDLVDGAAVWRLWPLALVVAGIAMLRRQRAGGPDDVLGVDSADSFDIFAMFSGADRRITSQDFSGGSVTALFGGAEVNLHDIKVENRPAVINVFCMFGGVGLKVSRDTIVHNQTVAIFGGSSDDRPQRKMLAGERPEIVVKGLAMFGGIGIEE